MDHRHLLINAWRHGHNQSISSCEMSEERSMDSGIQTWTSTQNEPQGFSSPEMSVFPGSSAVSASLSSPSFPNLSSHHSSFTSISTEYTHIPLHPNSQLWAMHLAPTLQISEAPDIDVVSITETARDVRISEEDERDEDREEQPLDLSVRRPSPSPSTSFPLSPSPHCLHSPSPTPSSSNEQFTDRPSVIARGPPSIRRSSSSVGPAPSQSEVHEHFRRSLSGKWPKRQKQEEEKTRSSPFLRKPSFHSNTPREQSTIITHSSPSIEEHFRKALHPDAFTKWKLRQLE